jgi:hypothetical protein
MAGKKAPPKPADPKPVRRRGRQRKPESEPVPVVNYRKTAKEVDKLIDCLAEWSRDLQAARSAAPELPPGSSRSRSAGRRRVSSVSLAPFYPRGNPLTQSMEFTDRDGAVWLAYIEGTERPLEGQPASATDLPHRHLRFDSATESRFTSLLPAGSPFLAEARLQSLLDESRLDPPSALPVGSPARTPSRARRRVTHVSARAVESGREAIADWSRIWQQTASRVEALGRSVPELLSGAAHTMHGMVEGLLGHRPARP